MFSVSSSFTAQLPQSFAHEVQVSPGSQKVSPQKVFVSLQIPCTQVLQQLLPSHCTPAGAQLGLGISLFGELHVCSIGGLIPTVPQRFLSVHSLASFPLSQLDQLVHVHSSRQAGFLAGIKRLGKRRIASMTTIAIAAAINIFLFDFTGFLAAFVAVAPDCSNSLPHVRQNNEPSGDSAPQLPHLTIASY